MSLPPELKNKIYFFALTSDDEVWLTSKMRAGQRLVTTTCDTLLTQRRAARPVNFSWEKQTLKVPAIRPALHPRLLLLNHQINAEAQPILNGANTFALENLHRSLHLLHNDWSSKLRCPKADSAERVGSARTCPSDESRCFYHAGQCVQSHKITYRLPYQHGPRLQGNCEGIFHRSGLLAP